MPKDSPAILVESLLLPRRDQEPDSNVASFASAKSVDAVGIAPERSADRKFKRPYPPQSLSHHVRDLHQRTRRAHVFSYPHQFPRLRRLASLMPPPSMPRFMNGILMHAAAVLQPGYCLSGAYLEETAQRTCISVLGYIQDSSLLPAGPAAVRQKSAFLAEIGKRFVAHLRVRCCSCDAAYIAIQGCRPPPPVRLSPPPHRRTRIANTPEISRQSCDHRSALASHYRVGCRSG